MESAAPSRSCLVRDASGIRQLDGDALGSISDLRSTDGTLVWLNLSNPSAADLALLTEEFAIHPLALEDVRKRHQRPKLDTYPDQHMLVAYEARSTDARSRLSLGEIHVFAGTGWLVSVHWGPSEAIEDLRQRFERGSSGLDGSVAALLYALLDEVVDTFFPVLDRISDRIDQLEERVLTATDEGTQREMLAVKREMLELRQVVAPMRDVANSLLRRDIPLIGPEAVLYYQDLYDHLVRVVEQVDTYRDLLAYVVDARLAIQSNSLNTIMKRLTAFTVILMLPTLIAGIYGMNFVILPELNWELGYPFALGLMLAAVLAAFAFFRAKGWL